MLSALANLYVLLGFYIVGYLCCIIQCCPAWQPVSCMTDCDCCMCRQLINVVGWVAGRASGL